VSAVDAQLIFLNHEAKLAVAVQPIPSGLQDSPVLFAVVRSGHPLLPFISLHVLTVSSYLALSFGLMAHPPQESSSNVTDRRRLPRFW
jgi:hypothetical protein